eukprot:2604425-Amphidinium_carterae.1
MRLSGRTNDHRIHHRMATYSGKIHAIESNGAWALQPNQLRSEPQSVAVALPSILQRQELTIQCKTHSPNNN